MLDQYQYVTKSQLKFILALLRGLLTNGGQTAVMGCVGSSGSLAQRLEGLDGDAAKALVAKEVQKGLDSRFHYCTRWWFQTFFIFTIFTWGNDPI